ncbi:MAG: bifunctional heptose 7-phosphate kinase/heptose 1-phosphate adenyltransferase [Actinobacteria bacterium]|nr:bifunctional heptose 7-phosphate kinase/heptose 1-phosphate adenyltransferase [Actinomycetota bacterium]
MTAPGGASGSAGRRATSFGRSGPGHRATDASRARRPLVVVGDALADRDVDGVVERICPDAPVPVVSVRDGRLRPGGAALAALVAARTGDRPVRLVTALGGDDAGHAVVALLRDAGVDVVDLGLAGPTPQKVRVRSAGQSLVRLDVGDPPAPCSEGDRLEETVLAGAGAVLVADYGRGLASSARVRPALEAAAAGGATLVWDPHVRGGEPVPGCRLVTPNRVEAEHFAGPVTGDGLAATTARAAALRQRWSAHAVAVTLGASGALLFDGSGTPLVVPATAVDGDPCGAGDSFSAAAALALAGGALPSEAVAEAVRFAGHFVASGGAGALGAPGEPVVHLALGPDAAPGTAATPPTSRTSRTSRMTAPVRPTTVATGGCFDVLHAGHVATLTAARALGDRLVVLINSDRSVHRRKGPGRPRQSERDRATVLHALACVDDVVVFDEDLPLTALDRLRPDVWVKGGDYTLDGLPEADLVASWGGQVVIVPYLEGRSTTRIISEDLRAR